MKKYISAALLLAVLLFVVGNSGCMVQSETLTSMLRAAMALKDKNFDEFNKYVDVDALIEQSVEVTIKEIEKRTKVGGAMFEGAAFLGKPLFVKLTHQQFKYMVNHGTITKAAPGLDQLPSSELLGDVVGLFGVPESSSAYQIIDVQKNGDREKLYLKINQGEGKEPLPLHLESVKAGDHYRVTRIENLDFLYKKFARDMLKR